MKLCCFYSRAKKTAAARAGLQSIERGFTTTQNLRRSTEIRGEKGQGSEVPQWKDRGNISFLALFNFSFSPALKRSHSVVISLVFCSGHRIYNKHILLGFSFRLPSLPTFLCLQSTITQLLNHGKGVKLSQRSGVTVLWAELKTIHFLVATH